jgi:hypothetical protein
MNAQSRISCGSTARDLPAQCRVDSVTGSRWVGISLYEADKDDPLISTNFIFMLEHSGQLKDLKDQTVVPGTLFRGVIGISGSSVSYIGLEKEENSGKHRRKCSLQD